MARLVYYQESWSQLLRWSWSILLLLLSPFSADAAALKASLDRATITMGETATLTLSFEDVNPSGTPNLPPLANLNVSGPSVSFEQTILNGASSFKRSFQYTLTPTQPGEIAIPALQITADNQRLTSQPLKLSVLKADAAATTGEPPLAFLRLMAPKTEVYVGEALPVEVHLCWQNAQGLQIPQLKAEGFSVIQSSQNNQPPRTRTQIGSTPYNVFVFKMAVTPARTGVLTLGPAETSLTALIPLPQRSFFGPNYQPRAMNLTSEPVMMNVLPLPAENVPPNFNGIVGSYQFSLTAGPTNLAVGDPITLKVQISGTGLLDALNLPPQPQWRDFTTYPPNSKIDSNDPLGLTGVKNFEQVVIPQNHEVTALPSLLFSYFDPNLKSYRTLSNQPIPLLVRPSATVAALPNMATNAAAPPPPVDDIVHIKARLDDASRPAPLLAQQTWFLSLQGVPMLAWLSLLVWRKRKELLANNPKLRRQREVAQRVRTGLKQLHAQATAQQSDEFFATLFRLLQEQLGERLDLPATAITEAVIDERLRGRTLKEQTIAALHHLFQTCNLARYAPNKSAQELAALIPEAEAALSDLQNLKA